MQKHFCETFAKMVVAVYSGLSVLDNFVWIRTYIAYMEALELKILNRPGYFPAAYVIYEK